ncbi:MAG: NAD(P)H-hydrate dehydratase [Treponema sp.]|nr:NAD(P)H-hydrate dehydratase [Treponema sp.]
MKPVFENPSEVEKLVKEKFGFPSFIMMENAAASMAGFILSKNLPAVFICGKGNNGADGLAAARMLFSKLPVYVFCPAIPKTEEGIVQYEMAKNVGVPFLSETKLKAFLKSTDSKLVCDCLYGTGFHGEIKTEDKKILEAANNSKAFRLACDIPSALFFKADATITMGTYKSMLYSDKAKEVTGEIILTELGIAENLFEGQTTTGIYLLEENDMKLPLRKKQDSHKGTYGHSAIISGKKCGAALLASEAAMNFGSGLTSVVDLGFSNLSQFKVNPELMISKEFPKTTKAVLIGSGLGSFENPEVEKAVTKFEEWFLKQKNPACVLDADLFSYSKLPSLLKGLNKVENARLVLTPHAKELAALAELLGISKNLNPSEALENRIEIGKFFTKKYPKSVLVMKGANTFIAAKGIIYIFDKGCQALAKGGSGDVLAGMITALLAQGYSAQDAAITAVFRHGTAASEKGKDSYSLTPRKLISYL